jgi:polysaccharide export outer membrane protein
VKASNSKVYYVITDAGNGEQVTRLPHTGSETVLDAIAAVPGLAAEIGKYTIRIARPGAAGAPHAILPVNWTAIVQHGVTTTNYQIMPGDRVYVTAGR